MSIRQSAAPGLPPNSAVPEHSHFDDSGAVNWFRTYAEAAAAARESGKYLFVECGRADCGSCRELIERVVPLPEIRDILRARFVCLAEDADRMSPEARGLASRLKPPRMLPFILVADREGRWLGGHGGSIDAASLLRILESAGKSGAGA